MPPRIRSGSRKAEADKSAKKPKAPHRGERVKKDTVRKRQLASAGLSQTQTRTPNIHATASIVEGGIEITGYVAETVPVADYANVVLGPIGMRWMLGGIDMSLLTDVEWGDIDDDGEIEFDPDNLSPEQRAVYEKVMGALRATNKIVGYALAEDRETVEKSVRLHNLREQQEAAAEKPKSRSRARK